jgi:hypothetical protein
MHMPGIEFLSWGKSGFEEAAVLASRVGNNSDAEIPELCGTIPVVGGTNTEALNKYKSH